MILTEYTISPNWFFAIQDMYNYGNYDQEKRLHYVNVSVGYLKGSIDLQLDMEKKERVFSVWEECVKKFLLQMDLV